MGLNGCSHSPEYLFETSMIRKQIPNRSIGLESWLALGADLLSLSKVKNFNSWNRNIQVI